MLSSYGKTLLMLREEDPGCRVSSSQQSGGYAKITYNNFSGSVQFSAQNLSPGKEYLCFIYASGIMPKYVCSMKTDKLGKGSAYGDFSFDNISHCGQIAAAVAYVDEKARLVLCGYKGFGDAWREDVKYLAEKRQKKEKPMPDTAGKKAFPIGKDNETKPRKIVQEESEEVLSKALENEFENNKTQTEEPAKDSKAEACRIIGETMNQSAQTGKESTVTNNAKTSFYFNTVKDYFEEIFADYDESVDVMREMIPNSKWQKVRYNGNDGFCLIGLILDYDSNEPLYICYGVPGENTASVPGTLQNYCQWLSSPNSADGYWMMYQDARTGETIVV